MGTPIEDIRLIAIPSEDDALDTAVAEMDRKFTEYASAVRQIASRLDFDRTPALAAAQLPPLPDETAAPVPERAKVGKRLAQRHSKKVDTPAPIVEEPAIETPAYQIEATEPAVGKQTVQDDAAVSAEAPDAPPVMTEDEALMASLDEQTLKALRLMHRLNPNKPLKDLVEQARKTPAEQPAKAANKNWFRLGR